MLKTEILADNMQRVEKALAYKKISKVEFQEKIGITSQRYNNWRNRGIPGNILFDVARIVEVQAEWLKYGAPEHMPDWLKTEQSTNTLSDLTHQWKQYKDTEDQAKKARLDTEKLIQSHPDSHLADEGIVHLDSLQVSTGYTRTWDQKQLKEMQRVISDEYFPFKTELKEDRKISKTIEERFPDLWNTIRSALSLKPKKPAFTWKEKKQ